MVLAPQKSRINRNLITLKVVIFFVITGLTGLHVLHSIWPAYLGLEFEEYRCIAILAPFISILGPLIAGPLADRLAARNANNFGRTLRILTAIFLILSVFVLSFFYLIPNVRRWSTSAPAVNFGCDANGAYIFQERCFEDGPCYHGSEKSGSLKLTNCTYTCQNTVQYENMYTPWLEHLPTPAPSTEHSSEFDYEDDSAGGVTESLRARRALKSDAASAEYGGGEQFSAEIQHLGHRVKRVERANNNGNGAFHKIYVEPPHLCMTELNEKGASVVKHCHVYTLDTHHIVVHGVMHGATNNDSETHSNEWCNYPLGKCLCMRIDA